MMAVVQRAQEGAGVAHDLAWVVLALLGLVLTLDFVVLPYLRSRRDWRAVARRQDDRYARRDRFQGWGR